MCLECEPRFAGLEARLSEMQTERQLLEERVASMERHHPIMDANTEAAATQAEAATTQIEDVSAVAEEALAVAEEAAALAEAAVLTALEEEVPDVNSGTTGEETGSEPTLEGEEEAAVVLSPPPEPEPEPATRSTTRFTRGRR